MNKDKIFVIGFDKSGETSDGSPSDFIARYEKKCLGMQDLRAQLLIVLVQNLTKFAKFEIKNYGLQVKIWVKMALTCQKNGNLAKFEIKNGK